MKILIFSDEFPPQNSGGSGVVAFWQAKELAKRGHEIHVMTAVRNKEAEGKTHMAGFDVHCIFTKYPSFLRSYVSLYNPQVIKKIKYLISEIKPDVVHAHNVHQYLSYASLSVAKRYSKKVFITLHDAMAVHYSKLYPKKIGNVITYHTSPLEQARYFWREWVPFRNLLIRRYLKNVDEIFAVSNALKEALEQNGIKNVDVLYNGINTHDFIVEPNEVEKFKEKYNLQDKKVMLFCGRLGRAKGGDIAVSLLKEISKTMPDTVLLIAGITENLKKDKNITFTGWLDREEMKLAYGASDLVLTLSTYLDPFPTVNLEAMAAGKPVIGTFFGGTPEAVIDEVTGFIVNPIDIADLVDKTLKLLKDFDLAKHLGQAGHERVKGAFDLSGQVSRLEEIYGQSK